MSYFLRILILFSILFIKVGTSFAIDLDLSIDDEIRNKYNPSKIEDDLLPPLPEKLKKKNKTEPIENINYQTTSSPVTVEQQPTQTTKQTQTTQSTTPTDKKTGISATFKKGTKFQTRIIGKITDGHLKGKKIKFILQSPVSTTYLTIPKNSIFYGEIIDSHYPQITGNGGLLTIKIYAVYFNGSTHKINGYVTKVNGRKVFLNDIKGNRKYLANTVHKTKWGRNYYKKMWNITKEMAHDKSTIILTPFPFVTGVAGLGINVVTSPISAIFSKGGRISIPANSLFEIKLLEDALISN